MSRTSGPTDNLTGSVIFISYPLILPTKPGIVAPVAPWVHQQDVFTLKDQREALWKLKGDLGPCKLGYDLRLGSGHSPGWGHAGALLDSIDREEGKSIGTKECSDLLRQ